MLATWTKLLPFFVVEWLAHRRAMLVYPNDVAYANPYPGVLLRDPSSWRRTRVDQVAAIAAKYGILEAEGRFHDFPEDIVAEGCRQAFLRRPEQPCPTS